MNYAVTAQFMGGASTKPDAFKETRDVPDRITSKNQKGGITAKNVNINQTGDIEVKKSEPETWQRWLYIAAAVATIIGLILAIGSFLGNGSEVVMTNEDKKDANYHVESHNQSGGITAGEVNIGPKARRLQDNHKKQLLDAIAIHPNAPINIDAAMGEGLTASGVDQVVYAKPLTGQQISYENEKWVVRIGSRD